MIVAIDGPSGSGKSSTARAVADALGGLFVDTGAMYRATSLYLSRLGLERATEVTREHLRALDLHLEVTGHEGSDRVRVLLGGEDVSGEIRKEYAGRLASEFAQSSCVRDAMVARQRIVAQKVASHGGVVVMEGRDIGTVVFPDADVKIFMTANDRVRAERRRAELAERGQDVALGDIMEDMKARDARDRSRARAPLRKADDAVEIDTTGLSFRDQVIRIVKIVTEKRQQLSGGTN
ncbi:MAG: cytidylate kinase [Bacteroidetes bacterium CG12_big_fil_rev_8_21_14_0_65_60_17]|nr:MAG: cytidylate kinase [Bacteroidetes bacterium CG12_big_fil_rev_8_21_14_0_65_60_17]